MSISDMNLLSSFIKCVSLGFLGGFLISNGPEVGKDVLPLVGLIAFIAVIFALWELATLEPASGQAVEAT
jgi:hypothetical protein